MQVQMDTRMRRGLTRWLPVLEVLQDIMTRMAITTPIRVMQMPTRLVLDSITIIHNRDNTNSKRILRDTMRTAACRVVISSFSSFFSAFILLTS